MNEQVASTTTHTTKRDVLIVSGMSGAGKGSAARVLEEFGWYVVDNVPAGAVAAVLDTASSPTDPIDRLALVLDVRSRRFPSDVSDVLSDLESRNYKPRILFLDASNDALIRRFNQVRRSHPLQGGDGLVDGIERERHMLEQLRGRAEVIVDSSALSVHDLRRRLETPFGDPDFKFHITVASFGFKYGVPMDVDMLVDMRFLPNPYWDPKLREFDGRNEGVSQFVLSRPGVDEYLSCAHKMIEIATDGYREEGKRYMTVGVGCTGGKHRSVAVTEELVNRLRAIPSVRVQPMHRDLGRE